MVEFALGALILIVISLVLSGLATLITGGKAEQGCALFFGAFLGTIGGHMFFGAWGPHILAIYLLPAVIGAIAGMILLPIGWLILESL